MPYKFKRISQTKANKIMRCFASDISATQTAKIVGVNRNTVNDWYNSLREKIAEYQEQETCPEFTEGMDHSMERQSQTNHILEDQEKRNTPKTEESEDEEQKTKYQFLVLKRETTARYTRKSLKTLQTRAFAHHPEISRQEQYHHIHRQMEVVRWSCS